MYPSVTVPTRWVRLPEDIQWSRRIYGVQIEPRSIYYSSGRYITASGVILCHGPNTVGTTSGGYTAHRSTPGAYTTPSEHKLQLWGIYDGFGDYIRQLLAARAPESLATVAGIYMGQYIGSHATTLIVHPREPPAERPGERL